VSESDYFHTSKVLYIKIKKKHRGRKEGRRESLPVNSPASERPAGLTRMS